MTWLISWVVIGGLVVGFMVGFIIGVCASRMVWRDELIKAGVGRWAIKSNGKRYFVIGKEEDV